MNFLNQILIKRTLNYNEETNTKKLNKKNIYIFPTWFGFQLGMFLFFCLLASTIYQNNFSLLIFIILFFIFFISILLTFQNLHQLSFHSKTEYLAEQDHFNKIKIHVVNHTDTKKMNVCVEMEEAQAQKDFFSGDNHIEILKQFKQRGIFTLPTLTCYTLFPFGIIKAWSYQKLNGRVFVYPKPTTPPRKVDWYMQNFNIHSKGEFYEFDRIEEYQPGDSLSKIAWKISTAKKKKFVKYFNSDIQREEILIDFDTLHPEKDFETRLQYCSFLILYCYDHEKKFALKINQVTSEFNSTKTHCEKILKKLCYAKNI